MEARKSFNRKFAAKIFLLIVADIEGCEAYVDDLIVYSQTGKQHIGQLCHLFEKLSQAKLTVNLVESEFFQVHVVY